MPTLAYIAGPYRASDGVAVCRNIQAARTVAMELWRRGYAVLCPHANSAHMDTDGDIDNSVFLAGCLEMVARCDLLVALEGWQDSQGTLAEIAQAQALGLPVYYWPQDEARLRLD